MLGPVDLAATETIGYYRARAADYDESEEPQARWAQASDAAAALARTDLGAADPAVWDARFRTF